MLVLPAIKVVTLGILRFPILRHLFTTLQWNTLRYNPNNRLTITMDIFTPVPPVTILPLEPPLTFVSPESPIPVEQEHDYSGSSVWYCVIVWHSVTTRGVRSNTCAMMYTWPTLWQKPASSAQYCDGLYLFIYIYFFWPPSSFN